MGTSGSGSGDDPWPDDDPTRIDGSFEGAVTPTSLPSCQECGAMAFIDDFTAPASAIGMGLFSNGQCVRARDGSWWYCANYSKDRGKLVMFPSR